MASLASQEGGVASISANEESAAKESEDVHQHAASTKAGIHAAPKSDADMGEGAGEDAEQSDDTIPSTEGAGMDVAANETAKPSHSKEFLLEAENMYAEVASVWLDFRTLESKKADAEGIARAKAAYEQKKVEVAAFCKKHNLRMPVSGSYFYYRARLQHILSLLKPTHVGYADAILQKAMKQGRVEELMKKYNAIYKKKKLELMGTSDSDNFSSSSEVVTRSSTQDSRETEDSETEKAGSTGVAGMQRIRRNPRSRGSDSSSSDIGTPHSYEEALAAALGHLAVRANEEVEESGGMSLEDQAAAADAAQAFREQLISETKATKSKRRAGKGKKSGKKKTGISSPSLKASQHASDSTNTASFTFEGTGDEDSSGKVFEFSLGSSDTVGDSPGVSEGAVPFAFGGSSSDASEKDASSSEGKVFTFGDANGSSASSSSSITFSFGES